MSDTKYLAGLYLRLSKDDERAGESVSIENQRLLLTQYVQEKGWEIKETYIDDGWSGTTMQRPAFQRMIRDAEDKRINLIIVKDLSRLGRNYIEIGRLTEDTLPRLGCRFVALNDSVDSTLGDNDMMVYRNLFNEFYSKDTSKKVRAVKQSCMRQGKFLGTYAPVGYMKDPLNKHKLVINEETAPIVRRIFKMRVQGIGVRAIANALNEDRIPSPRAIYYQSIGRDTHTLSNGGNWSKDTVKAILKNEAYIGNMLQGKQGTISYKNQSQVKKPEEQWVRVDGTHEALVSREDWDTVRSLDKRGYKPRPDSEGVVNLFSGLLRCADCGHPFRTHIQQKLYKNGTKGRTVGYICGNYARAGKSVCTIHTINEPVLIQLVLEDIKRHAESVAFDEQRVINTILNSKDNDKIVIDKFNRKQLRVYEDRLAEIDEILRTLYKDRVKGVITEEMFMNMTQDYGRDRSIAKDAVQEYREKIERFDYETCDVNTWIQTIRKYAEIEELSREVLIDLIDNIEIFEAEKVGTHRICKINIVYRFVGEVKETAVPSEDYLVVTEGGEILDEAV